MFGTLAELEIAVEKVAADEAPLDVERICRLAERVEFLKLRAIGAFDRSGEWQADGFVSTASALRAKCRMSHGTARGAVELARKLDALPVTAEAFGAGEISRYHAATIADAYTPERAAAIEQLEPHLVEVARLTDPGRLRSKVKQYTDALDGDGGAGDDARQYELNRLHLSKAMGRGVLDGSLDAESAEIVLTALDAELEAARCPGDERKSSQRRASTLVEICRRDLARQDDGTTRRRGQPHVSTVIDIAAFAETHPDLVADVRADAAHMGRLSRSTLERITCDCQISRIITDGPSRVLDVGHATRTVGDALWKALVARDGHCREPGCDRPPGMCEAHHIWHWEHGGPTDLANLELLCWHHHRQRHLYDARRLCTKSR